MVILTKEPVLRLNMNIPHITFVIILVFQTPPSNEFAGE